MAKVLCVLLSIFCCMTSYIDAKNRSLEDVILYAKEYRIDDTFPLAIEKKRREALLESVYSDLIDYSFHTCLESAIRAFFKDFLFSDAFTIEDTKQMNFRGKSKDRVFAVKDNDGVLQYIIKAFLNPRASSSEFLPEISSIQLIHDLCLPHVRAVQPLSVAKYSDGKYEWGLLLESAAKGKRLDEYIVPLKNPTLNSRERRTLLYAAQSVFARMGQSFARLHKIKSDATFFIPNINCVRYTDRLAAVLNHPFIRSELAKILDIQNFINYVEGVKEDVLLIPISYSYWHGDAHFGNMFYDEQSQDLYFIDVARMYQSVNLDGEPLQDGALDVQRIEECFRISALNTLTEEEYNVLLTLFHKGYEMIAGSLPDPQVRIFYKTFMLLGRLIIYAKFVDEKNEEQRSIDQAIFESALSDFVQLISTQKD